MSPRAATRRAGRCPGAWLVRPNVRGRNRLPAWLEDGYCAIGWYELGAVPAGTSREELAVRVDAAYPTASHGARRAWVGNLDRFLNRIDPGDLVVTPDGSRIYVGEVAGAPYHVERHEEAHRREVVWLQPDAPLDRHELSDRAQAKLRSMLTVCDLSEIAHELI